MKKIPIEKIKEKLFKVHGETVILDELTYINTMTKCRFIDKDYGEWWAKPNKIIWAKQGHPKRRGEKIAQSYKNDNKKAERALVKRKKTCLEKYGVENHMQLEKFSSQFRGKIGKKHTKETKELLSKKAVERIANGFNPSSHHKKGYFYSDKMQHNIWYDSSYELNLLESLENNDEIIFFRRNKIKIPFLYHGEIRNTIPDFYLENKNGQKLIVEVKPKRRIGKREKIKIKACCFFFKNTEIDFKVYTESKLF